MAQMNGALSNWTNVAVIGPAQHGKSTLAGYLLYCQAEVPDSVMYHAERDAEQRDDLTLKFAFLLDRTSQERKPDKPDKPDGTVKKGGRGQTHTTSWWGFEHEGRRFLLMDSPGHFRRSRHIIGAISEADAAVLVLDVKDYLEAATSGEVVQLSSGRLTLGMLGQVRLSLAIARFYGARQLVVALNKMDRIAFDRGLFEQTREHVLGVLAEEGWTPDQVEIVPSAVLAAANRGYNITERSKDLAWHRGPTLLEALTRPHPVEAASGGVLRLQLNAVYAGKGGHVPGHEMVITGKVLSGRVAVDQHIVMDPSGTEARVRDIQPIDNSKAVKRQHRWPMQPSAAAGEIVGLSCRVTSFPQGYETQRHWGVSVGEMVSLTAQRPAVASRFVARIRVLAIPRPAHPLPGRLSAVFFMGYFRTGARIEAYSLDGGSEWQRPQGQDSPPRRARPAPNPQVEELLARLHDADLLVEIRLDAPAPLDPAETRAGGSQFLLLDNNRNLLFGGEVLRIADEDDPR